MKWKVNRRGWRKWLRLSPLEPELAIGANIAGDLVKTLFYRKAIDSEFLLCCGLLGWVGEGIIIPTGGSSETNRSPHPLPPS